MVTTRSQAKKKRTAASSLSGWFLSHLPLVGALGTVVVAVVYPPELFKVASQDLEGNGDRAIDFLTSPLLILCFALALAGYLWSRKACEELSSGQAAIMYWHLSNATWWSFGCDVISGGLGAMPKMRRLYEEIDSTHLLPRTQRGGLDSVYFAEATIHVPLSWLCFYLTARQHPARHIVQAFLGGAQVVGTYCYYLPEYAAGMTHWSSDPLLFSLGIGFGIVWIIVPALLTWQSCVQVAERGSKKHR